MNKKGQAGFEKLIGFAIAIATLVIILIVTMMIAATGRSEVETLTGSNSTYQSAEYNATVETVDAAALVPTFMPIVVIAGIGAVAIGIIGVIRLRS